MDALFSNMIDVTLHKLVYMEGPSDIHLHV